jgi:uncharacterized protein with FMN-binding domain
MKSKVIRVVVAFVVIFILMASAAGYYSLNGMQEMRRIVINDVDLLQVEDGTYIGVFDEGNRWSNTVSVMVYGHKYIGINIVKDQTFHRDEITDELIDRIIDAQSLAVDTVSGGTISSKGYLKAIENALR